MEEEKQKKKCEELTNIVRKGRPMFGSLSSAYLPCGNPNCKCARGFLHGPMWRLVWKDLKGKQSILYIPKKRLEEIKKRTEEYKKAKELLKEIGLFNLSLFRKEKKRK